MSGRAIAGLYAVTPDCGDTAQLLVKAEAVLAGGARLLQYRNKTASAALRMIQGRALLGLCRQYRAALVINDHIELALALDADGLHIGDGDAPVAASRRRLGPGKLLGVSCYGQLENARAAAAAGASYVAFGGFFPSKVKPGTAGRAPTPIELLNEARHAVSLPIVAIGGITPENAPRLIAGGADSVAVISALFDAPDPGAAARAFSRLFSREK